MKKGITPVLASMLIIAMTVASAGILYTMVQEQTEKAKENADVSDLNLNIDSLKVEQCYNKNTYAANPGKETHIVVRNNMNQGINASEINPIIEGEIRRNFNITPKIVEPQETFTIDFATKFTSEDQILLSDGSNRIEHYCYGL